MVSTLNVSDLIIECYPQPCDSGMQLGIVPQGIMITHVPTGLIAISDAERNQYKNKKVAMDEIIKKLKSL